MKKKNNIQEDTTSKLWDNAKQIIANFMDTVGKIWHGYEVIGMEHLPEGPGLIVYYHGALVLDYSLLVARVYMQKGRHIQSLVDNGLYIFPGTKLALDLTGCTNGNKSKCVEILKKGNLLGISPGGLREGNFSDHQNYNLIWGNRTGFAQVALEAKVPIIPMFSQNIREALRTVGKTWWLRWLYDNYMRILVLPIYGGFPVKLRTYLGEPIPYDPNITATELAGKTKIAIENLRDRYQKKPGNILRALSERFDKHHKDN
ncbi:transmembrane protein 68-like isoform X2 [Hemicordylus capensis]|uniref:transmembrane protein 68-like isoform X2 n=1 Tax=Hemicordylus capensis TaxID=884348 RepID=UPI00230469BB|nr:transmembrane protein 68-like isoform X2 [Hemicordylus capensis]